MSELRRAGRGRAVLERLPDALVQAGAPRGAQRLVERFADQGVSEGQTPRLPGGLDDQPTGERLVAGGQRRLATAQQPLEQPDGELASDHGGDLQRLGGRRAQPRASLGDQVLDALGDARSGQERAVGPPNDVLGISVRESAQDLLDEERVALGPRLCPAHEVGMRGDAGAARDQLAGGVGVKPAEGKPVNDPLAPEIDGQVRQSARLIVAVARRGRHDERDGAPPDQVTQHHQRRAVGPMEVVDDKQHPPRAASSSNEARDRLEQTVTIDHRLLVDGSAVPGAELRKDPRQHIEMSRQPRVIDQ
jgi:hypothetical protein